MPKLKPDQEEVKRFLSMLWSGAEVGLLSICAISREKKLIFKFFKVTKLDSVLSAVERLASDHDVYHCVGLMRSRPEAGRGTEADVVSLPGLWLDVDCRDGVHNEKRLPTTAEALSFLKEFPLQPSLIVWSGGGLHVYYLFKEPLFFDTEAERKEVKDASSGFLRSMIQRAREKGWRLDNTSDLCRLLRVPGTYNLKRDPVAVEILEESPARYELDDFEPYLIDEKPFSSGERSEKSEIRAGWNGDLAFLPVSIPLRKLIREGEPPGSRSEAIMSVLTSLLSAGVHDDAIVEIFEANPQGIGAKYFEKGQGREKWLRDELVRATEKFLPEREKPSSSSERSEISEISELENRQWESWPVLGSEALPGFAGRFVGIACRSSEADPAAVLITFLSRFAVEVGPGPFLYIGDSKHHARVFAVVVGASSKSRKGTSGKPVERLFGMEHIAAGDRYISARVSPGPLSTGEGLICAVRDEATTWKVDKITGQGEEVVSDPGVQDKRLHVLDEEFSSALISSRRDGNTLSTILRSIWDSGNLEPLTKLGTLKLQQEAWSKVIKTAPNGKITAKHVETVVDELVPEDSVAPKTVDGNSLWKTIEKKLASIRKQIQDQHGNHACWGIDCKALAGAKTEINKMVALIDELERSLEECN